MNRLPLSTIDFSGNSSFVTSSKVMTSSAVGLVPTLYLEIELLCVKISFSPLILVSIFRSAICFCTGYSCFLFFPYLVWLLISYPYGRSFVFQYDYSARDQVFVNLVIDLRAYSTWILSPCVNVSHAEQFVNL